MSSLSEQQLLFALVAIATILVIGRGSAEVARRLGQPEVLGELIGGFVLGPSALGALLPGVYSTLFLTPQISMGLSLLSWIGAIVLLLLAGLEVDLAILRQELKPGLLAAACAVIPSLFAGTLFAWKVLGRVPPGGLFLGIVLSVTAVSVAAKILIERHSLRRRYAQVILAAGVATEVLVWLLIAVASAIRTGNPALAGLRATGLAVIFFLLMMTIGRRFTFWAMRRMSDMTNIVNGPVSLVLVLGFVSAAITQALGLHALLGAFVFGVLLSQAPRATVPLKESLQTMTVGFFAPVFFVLAGMRVDIFKLGQPSAILTVLFLFAVASIVKIGVSAVGGRLGGLTGWESALVGVGLNLKGGTDVIVAILGTELGLLPASGYTMYAVVAILTVLVSPPALDFLMRKSPPQPNEQERLNREEARSRAYLPSIERVLVPTMPELFPAQAALLVEAIAKAKSEEDEVFDIRRFAIGAERVSDTSDGSEVRDASDKLMELSGLTKVDLTVQVEHTDADGALQKILDESREYGLIAIGACPPERSTTLSLGDLQDCIIDQAAADVLVVVGRPDRMSAPVHRILVAVNGMEYSAAAGDVAAYIAKARDAELVLYNAVHSGLDELFWRETDHHDLLEGGYRILRDLQFRISRLGVRCDERVDVADDPGEAIMAELQRQTYDLVVLGGVDRGGDNRLYLGNSIQTVLTRVDIPIVLFVAHRTVGDVPTAT